MRKLFGILFVIIGIVCLHSVFAPMLPRQSVGSSDGR